MKFRGFRKKGLKRQVDNEMTISDPGSEDSWDLLYNKSGGDNVTNRTDKAQAKKISTSNATTSSALPPLITHGPKGTSQEKFTGNDVAVPQAAASNTNAEHKENIVANERMKKLLPLTSTPFVRNKRTPSFDVSSIISPIDVPSNVECHGDELPNDSGATLVVNRENRNQPSDETFNHLLDPGKKPAKPIERELSGVKELKTARNQADTTRQYAGGAVLRRKFRTFNGAQNDVESSWETTEATSSSYDLKKVSSSSSSMKIQGVSNFMNVEERVSQGNNAIPLSKTGVTLQDGGVQDPIKSSETNLKSQSVADPDKSSDYLRKKKQDSKVNSVPPGAPEIDSSPIKAKSDARCTDEVAITQAVNSCTVPCDAMSITEQNVCKEINSHQENNKPHDKAQSLGKKDGSNNLKDIIEDKKDKTSAIKEKGQESKSMESRKEMETVEDSNKSQDNVDNLPNQNRLSTAGHNVEILNNQLAECSPSQQISVPTNPRDIGNKVGMFSYQSEFHIQIGSKALTQSSCFGFRLVGENNKSNTQRKQESNRFSVVSESQSRIQEPSQVESSSKTRKYPINAEGCTLKETVHPKDMVTTSNQVEDSNEIQSSSEEERLLLRAQCLKTKEYRSHSPKKSLGTKILDKREFRLTTQGSLTSNKSDQTTNINKSSTKSTVLENREGVHGQNKEMEPGEPSTPCIYDSIGRSSQTHDQSGFNGVSDSSCDPVLLSRNPTDDPVNWNDDDDKDDKDDDLQLEIISTSEDESVSKRSHHPRKRFQNTEKVVIRSDKLANRIQPLSSKNPRRVVNISFKAKEIRRRRESKIRERLNSLRDSSESDSQCLSERKKSMHGVVFKPSETEINLVKDQKKLNRTAERVSDSELINSGDKSICVSNPEVQGAVQESPVVSDNYPDTNKRKKVEASKKSRPSASKRTISSKDISSMTRKKPPKQKVKDAVQNISDHMLKSIAPEKAVSIEQDQPQGLKTPTKKTVSLERHKKHVKKDNLVGKKKTVLSSEKSHIQGNVPTGGNEYLVAKPIVVNNEHTDENLRCSKRNRRPPSQYWLGQRHGNNDKAPNKVTLQEVEQAFIPLRTESASMVKSCKNWNLSQLIDSADHKDNQPTRAKRKIEKPTRSEKAKTLKRVKQMEPEPTASECDHYKTSTCNVLVYEAENPNKQDSQDLNCNKDEVKLTDLVWGYKMKGHLLSLGPEAIYNHQKSNTYNQVIYVLEGKIHYRLSEEAKTLKTGSAFIVPKGEEYHIKNVGKTTGKLFVTSCGP